VLRLKTCSRSSILLYPKTVCSGLSALVYVLMVLVLCPAVMEDCRLLFEAKALEHCGPLRYSQESTRVKISESYIEPGLRICSECSELYKNSAVEGKVFKKLCEDMRSEHTIFFVLRYFTMAFSW
jgi:hypothetical protein